VNLLNLKLRVLMPVFDKLNVLRIIRSVGVRCFFAQMFRRFVLHVGEERVVLFRDAAGSLFLHTHGLFVAFAFETAHGFSSFVSRSKIATVENSDWKTFLEAKGQSRFLDSDGIAELLDARLSGEALATAKSDLDLAHSGLIEAGDPNHAAKRGRDDAGDPGLPVMAQHAPIPLRVENDVIAVPRLNVPRGDSWWDNEDWRIGKKFALPEFDHGRQLRVELEQFRTFGQSAIQLFEQVKRGLTRHWRSG
jgi:hypothetical protein